MRKINFMILAIMLLVISCSGGGAFSKPTPRPTKPVEPKTIYSKTVTIKEDEYLSIPLLPSINCDFKFTMHHKKGPALDVYLLDDENYNKLKSRLSKGERGLTIRDAGFRLEGLSDKFTSNIISLKANEYSLVIDNTDFGPSEPPMNFRDDVATVFVEIKIWRGGK